MDLRFPDFVSLFLRFKVFRLNGFEISSLRLTVFEISSLSSQYLRFQVFHKSNISYASKTKVNGSSVRLALPSCSVAIAAFI